MKTIHLTNMLPRNKIRNTMFDKDTREILGVILIGLVLMLGFWAVNEFFPGVEGDYRGGYSPSGVLE